MGRQDVPGRRVRCVRVGRVRRGGGGGPAYLRHPCHRLRGGTGGGQGPESHARPGTSAGRSGPGDRLGAHGGMQVAGRSDGEQPAHELPDPHVRRRAIGSRCIPREPVPARRRWREGPGRAADRRTRAGDPERGGARHGGGSKGDTADAGTTDGAAGEGRMTTLTVTFTLNGKPVSLRVAPAPGLLATSRYRLALTGPRKACAEADGGAGTR